nr:SIR2 family protein [uncultured Porphyromonas sp.]
MKLQEAIDKIFEGNCLLFLGSGFSLEAKNAIGGFVPSASKLCSILDEASGNVSEGDLEDASESYIAACGEYQLIPLLKDLFTIGMTSDEQDVVCSCSWYRIYTTNYDNVVETSALKRGKRMESVTLLNETREYKDKKNIVIHLNGCINSLSPESLSASFKLTSASYATQEFQRSEWVTLFQYDLEDADAVFFIGFSLKHDLDLKRIIFSHRKELLEKTFFILRENEQESIQKKVEKFGSVHPMGLKGFANMITEQKATYIPPVTSLKPNYICFEKSELSTHRPSIQDEDAHRLFYLGEFKKNLIEYSIRYPSEYPYYIQRESLDSTLNSILNGEKNILVHSDLGNGKTMFIEGLKVQLTLNGYEVYSWRKYSARQNSELGEICHIKSNKVVIILEDYSQHWDLIDVLALHRTDQILIVSERTVINDMAYDKLVDRLRLWNAFRSVDLNIMGSNDIQGLINIFNMYGLWGELAAREHSQKIKFLEDDSHKSICAALVSLLKSPIILKKFRGIIQPLQDKSFFEIIVFLLISRVLRFETSPNLIGTALDTTELANAKFRKDNAVGEFLSLDNGDVKLKSSIFASVILSNVIAPEVIKRVLVKAFKNMDNRRSFEEYKNALKTLLSFTNLRRAIRTDDYDPSYLDIMSDFFQKVRNCDFCQKNPHYWLQYAILKLEQKEFAVAGQFFDNAYSYAALIQRFTTYQIDNHYARYLLANSIDGGGIDPQFMQTFNHAHGILVNPRYRKDTKFYPFKVAQIYPSFWAIYKSKMNSKDRTTFCKACQEILDLIKKFKDSMPLYRQRREVKTAEEEIEKLLIDISKSLPKSTVQRQ